MFQRIHNLWKLSQVRLPTPESKVLPSVLDDLDDLVDTIVKKEKKKYVPKMAQIVSLEDPLKDFDVQTNQ